MKRSLFVSILALAFVAGCSGSGLTPTASTSSTQGATTQAKIVIVVPSATAQSKAKRSPQYVSPATESLSFQLSNQTSAQIVSLSNNPNCSTANGSQTCTLTFNVTVGTGLTLAVEAFNSTDGSGSVLSLNTIPVTIAADQINVINITLNGVVASFGLALSPSIVAPNSTGTVTATYSAYDAQGYTIVGSAPLVDANNTTITPVLTASPAGGPTSIGALSGNAWTVTETNPSAQTITFTVSPSSGSATPGTATLLVGTATPSPSPSPTASAGGNACQQAWSSSAPSGLHNVASTFYTTIIPGARNICLSAWDMSSDIDTALIAAAHNGANVWALAPYSQKSSNAADAQQLVAAGVHWVNEYTGSSFTPITTGGALETGIHSPMDIHSKFALVDGVAYMDGHNWFTTDVVMQDGAQGDYNAMLNNLSTFATPAPTVGSFTTDKQLSLRSEYQYLQSIAGSIDATSELDWSAESYNPTSSTGGETDYNQDVFAELCAIASSAAKPAMKFYVESYPYTATAGTQIQLMVSFNANSHIYSSSSGLEKIALWRKNGVVQSAWFGSSNATSTDLFDWGMVVTDPGMLSSLQTWFDSGISGKADKKGSGAADSACLAPNV